MLHTRATGIERRPGVDGGSLRSMAGVPAEPGIGRNIQQVLKALGADRVEPDVVPFLMEYVHGEDLDDNTLCPVLLLFTLLSHPCNVFQHHCSTHKGRARCRSRVRQVSAGRGALAAPSLVVLC